MSRFGFIRGATVRHGVHLFRNRRTMWQMLRDTFNRRYKMSFFTIIVIVFTLLYVLDPIDLIPDWIPVVGWIDDGLVIYLLVKRLQKETQRYLRFKASERRNSL